MSAVDEFGIFVNAHFARPVVVEIPFLRGSNMLDIPEQIAFVDACLKPCFCLLQTDVFTFATVLL